MKINFFLLLILSCLVKSWSQGNQLIQISGLVLTDIDSEPKPLPFAEISIIGTGRGVYADSKGFFSMAVQKNDTLVFNYLGFKPIFYIVPDSLGKSHYTIFQIMTRDTIYLPETIVYPWPDKNYFKQEFLAMDISNVLQETALKNLAQDNLRKFFEFTPTDGQASSQLYLVQQAQKNYYNGQFRPNNLLSPTAWIAFFKAWKRGDFKRKK
ncbi:MAG: carboxypeptidase-like regulatory domain-containing protein [Saprospiraceae bacterium]|jgi:hypothetical protein|nr:carboxypeptidase-like regulatory domain-containing protein [Candidatus Defluviibacterium haderslevense]MCC7027275.1 carboxypeptidase-like regulatory domain-containing protein [Saprospiraceae bacterium]MCI1266832.1 carboxypeptidase-like regulatory domain-containing protein [Saprospiraceae bacterium]